MSTSNSDVQQLNKWTRRAFISGFVQGLWPGVMLGAFIVVYFKLAENWSFLHFLGLLSVQLLIMLVTTAVRPKLFEQAVD
jgi:hypothetical protein